MTIESDKPRFLPVRALLESADPEKRAQALALLADLRDSDLSIIAEEMSMIPEETSSAKPVPIEEGFPVLLALLQETTSALALEGILYGLGAYQHDAEVRGLREYIVPKAVLEALRARTESPKIKEIVTDWLTDMERVGHLYRGCLTRQAGV